MGNRWDERYATEEYYYGKEPNDFLREQASQIKNKGEVLCLAEGEGRNAVFLAQQGLRVTAIDLSQEGLKKLKALAKEKNVSVETHLADITNYDLGHDRWDAIISIWCHLPKSERAQLHRRVIQALKPGGVLIFEAYTPDQLKYKTGGPPDANLLATKTELETELQGLETSIEEKIREVHEGKGHSGPSAVVQALGKKPL